MSERGGHAGRLLAEMGVIVLGVLIAFWVEDYREERQDRAEERVLLETVREEYAENRARLDRQMGVYERRAAAQAELIELGAAVGDLPDDSVHTLYAFALRGGWYDPAQGAWTTLVSSGGLSLVQDAELRSLLGTWGTEWEDFHRVQEEYNRFLHVDVLNWIRQGWIMPPRFGENADEMPTTEDDYASLAADRHFQGLMKELIGHMSILRLTGGEVSELIDATQARLAVVLEDS